MITSTPASKILRAVFSVIPMPPAEFSPLAIDQIGPVALAQLGIAAASPSRPGWPTMSPMKRTRIERQRRAADTVPARERTALNVAAARTRRGRAGGARAAQDLSATARRCAAVSFAAGRGELLAIIGPNGAGKTTLLSIIAGIQPADGGSVTRTPSEIGWVPQQAAIYRRLTVEENLRLFANLEGVDDVETSVDEMLARVDLADRRGDQVSTLSGGNQQRVNIAIGLLSRPVGPAPRRADHGPRPAQPRAALGVLRRASPPRARP